MMNKLYSQQDGFRETAREGAIRFLLKHTNAFRDAIEHFVDTHWQEQADWDENLDRFETYMENYQQSFTR